ncbi:DUF547 domain-containing protein, partial [Bacteriovoracaceae bacterium]|nr:DUF547 domain-containing protein [Bacteriovoracaceae bacterium]
ISLLGKKVTLDNIEHDMIRKDFDEPRIHFAVNCASIGCPSLLSEAFTFNQIEQQLEKATKLFLNDKSKNYIKDNKIYLSKIFKWYGEDFNSKHGSFINFVSKYLKTINPKKNNDVEWTSYNWDLNGLKE